MHRKHMLSTILLVTAIFSLLAGSAFGGAQEIKARMADRLPVIMDLKQKGIVGENNLGLLEFVGAAQEKADVVAAENADRKKVYEAIARKQGTTADLVGRRRAMQLHKIARPGEWIQDAGGKWRKK